MRDIRYGGIWEVRLNRSAWNDWNIDAMTCRVFEEAFDGIVEGYKTFVDCWGGFLQD